jgi:alkylation response protein AidB-like acyl-CoA dehydrogenase
MTRTDSGTNAATTGTIDLRTGTRTGSGSGSDPVDQLLAWLETSWDPDLTVGEWWERLGLAGWAAPMLPPDTYGRGLSRGDALRVQRAVTAFGALGPPAGLGLALAAPTIATHGTAEHVERFVRAIVTGREAWCQLFSEPGAGSDLAGLSTRAVRDGDTWIVNGQKVWTSGGRWADMGMLLARTNPEAPKHQGITWFALDMQQPGVEVRPLREMTGNTMFSEVFFTDARVGEDARIGDLNRGWQVANTTLLWERSGMGAGGGGGEVPPRRSMVLPGTVGGMLGRRAGDLAPRPARRRTKGSPAASAAESAGASAAGSSAATASAAATAAGRATAADAPGATGAPARGLAGSPAKSYVELARTFGRDRDPVVRQRLVQLHILRELARLNTQRHKAVRAAGGDIPGIANFSKLLMADVVRLTRDLGLQILGPRGTLHAYDEEGRAALADEPGGVGAVMATSQALSAQALPIYGGTDQIQRNILGERTLGLPKEPGDLSHVPFNELPKNG